MIDSEATELLRELVKWTRVGFYSNVRTTLESVLVDEKRRTMFHLADGTRTVDDIRKITSSSPNTVVDLFRDCEALGLMTVLPTGQRRKLFELEQFGLAPVDSHSEPAKGQEPPRKKK